MSLALTGSFLTGFLRDIERQRVAPTQESQDLRPVRGHSSVPVSQVPWCQCCLWLPRSLCLRKSCPDSFPFPPLQAQVSSTCCPLPPPFLKRDFSIRPSCPSISLRASVCALHVLCKASSGAWAPGRNPSGYLLCWVGWSPIKHPTDRAVRATYAQWV